MDEQRVLQVFRQAGAILDIHAIGVSGAHLMQYAEKRRLRCRPQLLTPLCVALCRHFELRRDKDRPVVDFDVVVGAEGVPAIMAYIIANLAVHVDGKPINAGFARKEGEKGKERLVLDEASRLVIEGQRALVVEDVLLSAGSAAQVVESVRQHKGFVMGVGGLWLRGEGEKVLEAKVPLFKALLNLRLPEYESEAVCPGCIAGIPVDEVYGHGKEYMDAKRAAVTLPI